MDVADLKNRALASWIKTVPSETGLAAFLETVPIDLRPTVEAAVRSAYEWADHSLATAVQAGPLDLAAFHRVLGEQLRSKFNWIDDAGLSALRSFTGWYAWHEGYLAQ